MIVRIPDLSDLRDLTDILDQARCSARFASNAADAGSRGSPTKCRRAGFARRTTTIKGNQLPPRR
jgi:hypothetical protein